MLGLITRTVEGLEKVLGQRAACHRANQPIPASETDDRAAGAVDAARAAYALSRAADGLDEVWEAYAAWSHNGVISWRPRHIDRPYLCGAFHTRLRLDAAARANNEWSDTSLRRAWNRTVRSSRSVETAGSRVSVGPRR